MKFCDLHIDHLDGQGECFVCERIALHNMICQLQTNMNLDSAVIQSQRAEIAELKRQLHVTQPLP